MCPFCNINKEKNRIIKAGKYVWVIMSNPRLVEGHLLVVPKRHVEKLSELNNDEKDELVNTTIEFQELILKKYASGCDIRQNCRPFQKESKLKVNHLHIHLQPRELFDELYKVSQIYEKELFKDLGDKEIKKFTKLFSNTK